VTNEPVELAAAPRSRGFPWWVIGCGCTGCLAFLLLAVGVPAIIGLSIFRVYKAGRDPSVQRETFERVVANAGPPPGFVVAWANTGPWPLLDDYHGVLFVPESTQGDLETQVQSADTFGLLVKSPEDEWQRAQRDQLFENGRVKADAEVLTILQAFGADSDMDDVPTLQTGTLSGHRFPLRYATAVIDDESRGESTPERVRVSKKRHRRSGAVAIIDLTPPGVKGTATVLWLLRKTSDPFAPEYLTDFCRNFRPGE
jgi:hypothetical protein